MASAKIQNKLETMTRQGVDLGRGCILGRVVAPPAGCVKKPAPRSLKSLWRVFIVVLLGTVGQSGQAIELRMIDQGTNRSRVVISHDPAATEAYRPNELVVEKMVERGLRQLTGKTNLTEAWRQFVSTQDVVGIKVHTAPGPNAGTRPAVVEAVIKGLLQSGIPSRQIVIWDRYLTDLTQSGFATLAATYHVQLRSADTEGYDGSVFYDTPLLGNLIWGDLEFGKKGDGVGRRSHVTRLLTRRLTRLIVISPLLNHNQAGVSGNLYSLSWGSVDNSQRFDHSPDRLANVIPEIYALEQVGDRVALCLVDALICQYEGGERGLLHYTKVLNEIRLSTDPVALDVLSLDELRRHQTVIAKGRKENRELYANAALLELGINEAAQIKVERLTDLP